VTRPSSRRPRTAVLSANSGWNVVNFRKPIVEALRASGWDVVVLAPDDGKGEALRALGARYVPIRIDSSGTSILGDGRLLLDYLSALWAIRPQAFLGFTVKPNVYGSLAAGLLGIRIVNNISGLGTAFLRGGLLGWLVGRLYRLALRRSACVFFQNPDDRQLFVGKGLVRPAQAKLLPGSGIDLDHFRPEPKPAAGGDKFRFLFVGRLLRDKGLIEYAEAARLLRDRWPDVEFAILGSSGSDNPSAVPKSEVKRWQAEGVVHYLGESNDVRPFLATADCVVLPSYREGLSRSLLEAAAMARPMIASDVPGCREVVVDGETGLLCEARSTASLAQAMQAMLVMDARARIAMGSRARKKAVREFDQALVANAYLEALR
jgi:glycosyltransferase involved in cell wall biosynthesis